MKDEEQQLMEEINTLKKKMAEDKKNIKTIEKQKKEEKNVEKKSGPRTPFAWNKFLVTALPFIVIIVFLIGFFAGMAYQKNQVVGVTPTPTLPTLPPAGSEPVAQPGTSPTPVPVVPVVPVNNECVDTDNGQNVFEKGTTFFNDQVYYDVCSGKKAIREYYCKQDNTFSSVILDCDLCTGGVCMKFEPRVKDCTETDNWVDFEVKGYVKDSKGVIYTDTCSTNSLEEWYCNAFGVADTQYKLCDECLDGACVPQPNNDEPLCTDTDGGINLYEKGTATDSKGKSETDTCQGRTLEEFYCGAYGYLSRTYKLCNQCVEGACIDV